MQLLFVLPLFSDEYKGSLRHNHHKVGVLVVLLEVATDHR
jgi:hypothetical protein